jgi:hypothetical protein
MNYRGWMGILSIAVLGTGWLASGNLQADPTGSDGYSLEDFDLHTANDLLDVCSLDSGHSEHTIAMAFCYGFFEGATHYDDALADSGMSSDIVCNPAGITRTQAVAVFVQYMQANPQYGLEPPIDAIFRALVAKWPCVE